MIPFGQGYAAQDGAGGGDVEEGVGLIVPVPDNPDFMVFQKRQFVHCFRDDEVIRFVVAQGILPDSQFCIHGGGNHPGRLGGGENFCIRESIVDDRQAEVVVRVEMGNEDNLQFFPQRPDFLNHLFCLRLLELGIHEESFFFTVDNGGSDIENGLRAGMVDFERKGHGRTS